MRKTFGLSEDEALDMDGAKGWVFYNWAVMNEASVWGTGKEIVGDGYVAQERRRITGKQNGV